MNLQQIAPTRSNLMAVRRALAFAREGYDILDRKREVLITELLRVSHEATELQARVWSMLAKAYQALQVAQLELGREHLEWAALSVNKTIEVDVTLHSIMGVVVPSVTAQGAPPDLSYSLGNTTVALDEAAQRFREVLVEVPRLAELLTTTWRLARDLQTTQRRVNALEHILIPAYEDAVRMIESALEEREREELFRMKRVKALRSDGGRVSPAEGFR